MTDSKEEQTTFSETQRQIQEIRLRYQKLEETTNFVIEQFKVMREAFHKIVNARAGNEDFKAFFNFTALSELNNYMLRGFSAASKVKYGKITLRPK